MSDVDPVFEEHRPGLARLAYRMLGSLADADDVLQDAYLRWDREGRASARSPRPYLYGLVTRLCIDQHRARAARRQEYIGPWLPEPVVEPSGSDAEVAESVSLALLVVLESLTPVERAAYLLRRVFDYDYAEIADVLGKSEANCRQLVSRAEGHVLERRPRFEPDPAEAGRVTDAFLQACASGDLGRLVQLLTDDAVLYSDGGGKARAALAPIHGADRIARFLLGIRTKWPADMEVHRARVNGRPGLVATLRGQPLAVWTFDLDGPRIRSCFVVSNPDKLTRVRLRS
jgi:RNA polymerase sigma-70 factor (ECF subfamily)